MLKAGATILEIMQRLGHANIATTSRYLNSLASAENRLVSHVLDAMGFADEGDTFVTLWQRVHPLHSPLFRAQRCAPGARPTGGETHFPPKTNAYHFKTSLFSASLPGPLLGVSVYLRMIKRKLLQSTPRVKSNKHMTEGE